MKDVKITNMVKFYSLFLLYEKPHHGYDIIKSTGAKLGRTVSPGQIYPFISLLEKRKYLTVRETGKREKKIYTLTREGKVFVKDLLEKFGDIVHSVVESNIKKCAHCECEIYRGGHEKKVKGRLLYFCCERCAAALSG